MLNTIENTLKTRIESGDVETTLTAAEIVKHAYMLTQYQIGCPVGYDELTDYIVAECMEDIMITIDDVNAWLSDNGYYDDMIYSFDEFDDVLEGWKPFEIARAVHFGNINWFDNYWKFNGYGNIESVNESVVIDEYREDVKRHIFECGDVPHGSDAEEIANNAEIIIETCNTLISAGY